MELPRKGRYRHFKGGEYEVLHIARHSETDEPLVIYRALYPCPDTPNGEGVWARPLSSWNAPAEAEGKAVPRFAPIADDAPPMPEPPPEEAFFAEPPEMPEMPSAAPAPVSAGSAEAPEDVLKRVFGYDSFREGQRETINAILAGRDVLGVMPTGSGKSICYQVPALTLPGCALVVSPLISLMKDQVAALKQAGVAAAFLNSSLSERQMDAALANLAAGRYKLAYVAPERLLTSRFLSLCRSLSISMVAVDEAHCISQWGQDFRPSYLDIPKFIASLPARPRLCAFTATATMRVRGDIQRLLGLRDPFSLVTGFDRPNLRFFVERPRDKMAALTRVLKAHEGESGIVYCATRKAVEQVCDALRGQGVVATRYHAGLPDAERRGNQEDFSYDRAQVMVATNAFGMGIDKSDVRFVVHYNMPKDLESYYQEAGRAGRDGEAADCVLLYAKGDVATQRFLIDRMGEEGDLDDEQLAQARQAAWQRLEQMTAYCQTDTCLRACILRYFGEDAPDACGACGNCLRPAQRTGRHASGNCRCCAACRTSTAASARASYVRRCWEAGNSAFWPWGLTVRPTTAFSRAYPAPFCGMSSTRCSSAATWLPPAANTPLCGWGRRQRRRWRARRSCCACARPNRSLPRAGRARPARTTASLPPCAPSAAHRREARRAGIHDLQRFHAARHVRPAAADAGTVPPRSRRGRGQIARLRR